MNRVRIWVAGLAALAITTTLLNCRGKDSSQYTLGGLFPLTGGAAPVGKAGLEGVQLAVEEYNNARAPNERAIVLAAEDDRAEASTGVTAFQNLVSVRGVQAVIGPMASGVAMAVAPIAEERQVVILSPGASTPALTPAGDYIFRNEISEAFGASEQAKLAFDTLGFRTVAVLFVNNEYGQGTASVFRDRFVQVGGQVVAYEGFPENATDFRTALTRIRGLAPDALFIVYQVEFVNIVRQSAELGLRSKVYTTPVFESPENLETLGSLAEGIIYTIYGDFSLSQPDEQFRNFTNSYRAKFGNTPTYYSALGYDAARIMITALRASAFDSARLKDELYRIRDFPGLTGRTSFDQNGDVLKPVRLKTVRGGAFVDYRQ